MSRDNLDQSSTNGKFPFDCDWLDRGRKILYLGGDGKREKNNVQNFVRFLEFLSLNFDRLRKIMNCKQ